MRTWLVAAMMASLAVAVACSSFSSDDASAPTTPDASAPVDAQAPVDAGPRDEAAAPDAGGCAAATGYLVCADFPDPTTMLPTGGFGGVTGSPSSALAIEADPAGSSNYALHARGDVFDGGMGQVYLYKDMVAAPQTLTFSAHVRADGKGVANYIEYFSIITTNPTDIEVVVGDSSGFLVVDDSTLGDGGTAVRDQTVGPVDATGIRFEVQLWFDTAGTSIEVRKDGVVSLSKRPLGAAGGRDLTGRSLRFGAGVFYASSPTTGAGAFLDDIRLSVTP